MANELHSPTEQLSYQYHLASDGEAEAGGEGGAGSPAEEAEDSSDAARAAVKGDVEGPVDRGAHRGGVQRRSGEVEEQEGREEDGPNEERVDEHVYRVAVVRAVEGEVALQVEDSAAAAAAASHRRRVARGLLR